MAKKIIKQFLKFMIVGAVNTGINLLVLYILTDIFGVYYILSAILAFLAAVTNSFLLNKKWTFEEDFNYKISSKYAKFITISVIALLFNLIILYVLVEYFSVWYMLAQLVGVISNLAINFSGNRLWTFRR